MSTTDQIPEGEGGSGAMVARVLGLLGLLTSVVATLMLTLVALKFFPTLPGCGPESGCDKVTSGIWGSIPWIGWPVSFIGLCYFTSMLVIWLRGGLSRYYLWIMRLGMLCSVGFVVIMISEQALCKWCLVSHVGNLVAWSC
ncbi:MAG: vitamin K epoxide reductase family protein, partial [Planctomycetota bacterium]|nr:vitamin K epoxide reductase family protein [Planctomycetota bacterium]